MASAKKCDRCGRLYDDTLDAKYVPEIQLQGGKTVVSIIANYHNIPIDLCAHCSKMFEYFLTGVMLKTEKFDT